MKKIAVIGVGNILFADDGAGVYGVEYVRSNYTFEPEIELVDGGVLGLNLMHYFLEYDEIIILDTISIEERPGTIYHLPSEALLGLGNSRNTVHEIEVIQMIETGTLMGIETEVSVVGIIPYDIESVLIDLSPAIKPNFTLWIDALLSVLKEKGIESHPNDAIVTLDEVIEAYRNPVLRAG